MEKVSLEERVELARVRLNARVDDKVARLRNRADPARRLRSSSSGVSVRTASEQQTARNKGSKQPTKTERLDRLLFELSTARSELKAGKGARALANQLAKTAESEADVMLQLAKFAAKTGVPLLGLLNRVESILQQMKETEEAKTASNAGPQATVKLLQFLPLAGLLLGNILGSDPLSALFGTPVGWAMLILGSAFWIAGVLTTRKMLVKMNGGETATIWDDPRIRLQLVAASIQSGQSFLGALQAAKIPGTDKLKRRVDWVNCGFPEWANCLEKPWRKGISPLPSISQEISNINAASSLQTKVQGEKLAVALLIPLGLLYLPAFILIGVVPVLISVV